MKRCHACAKTVEITNPVGRREVCAWCGSDLHCCQNCTFFAPAAPNECREPQAERVIEKDRSNFCDYFAFRDADSNEKEKGTGDSAKARLETLFKPN